MIKQFHDLVRQVVSLKIVYIPYSKTSLPWRFYETNISASRATRTTSDSKKSNRGLTNPIQVQGI